MGRGVVVEKLAHLEFEKIGSRQEALQTIFPSLLDIFYHPIFDFSQKNRLFNSHRIYQHLSGPTICKTYSPITAVTRIVADTVFG